MTISQSQASWELCRLGYPLIADAAEKHWENGEVLRLDRNVKIPRRLEQLLAHCNDEAGTEDFSKAPARPAVMSSAPVWEQD